MCGMTAVFRKASLTSILLGCISSHFQGTAHATVIMTSPGNHYHGKDHGDRDEILIIVGMFVDEIGAPLWEGEGCRTHDIFREAIVYCGKR